MLILRMCDFTYFVEVNSVTADQTLNLKETGMNNFL